MSATSTKPASGMGSLLQEKEKGVSFRVWAPHAQFVSVIGTAGATTPHIYSPWNRIMGDHRR